jgi:hypothetical protein
MESFYIVLLGSSSVYYDPNSVCAPRLYTKGVALETARDDAHHRNVSQAENVVFDSCRRVSVALAS